MNKEERITYEEFMTMFKNAPRIAYMLYDKAEDEIDRLNNFISELEKWLIEYRTFIDIPDYYEEGIIDCIDDTLNKLKQLKEKE